MKHRTLKILRLGLVAALAISPLTKSSAQTNIPSARLAIVSESSSVLSAADLLAVELSAKPQLQLLERAQIEKVYREQGLSAGNKDALKLGQLLGADGLLLLTPVTEGTNQFVQVRLVAVKPSVVIASVRSVWPVQDMNAWSHWLANHFDPLFPKISVLVRDAIPISVVNLRSATRSAGSQETERQLTSLVTERLTRVRELFVLERRRLDLSAAEKELQGMGESSFWNGSYLLEGTIDRDGYSKETVTLDARLIPPQNGRGIEISIKGPRENLVEVIERLAAQILVAVKKSGNAAAWQPDAEAANYLEEAKWALRWGMIPEAQAAADAAWALGKRDLACALTRGSSHVNGVIKNLIPYRFTTTTIAPGVDANGLVVTSSIPNESHIQMSIKETLEESSWGGFYKRVPKSKFTTSIEYHLLTGLPSPENIERAKRTLELYLDFSRTSPEGQPQVLTRGKGWNDWHNSEWYSLGIESLVAASEVLQNFYFVPHPDTSVASSLAELRLLTRTVATMISESPTVRDGYFVGGRIATHDELAHTMTNPNIFTCMAEWGCFWQERPEDAVALYRKLMESPVFCYIHKTFWNRNAIQPRLVAWSENDRKRLPLLWESFFQELNGSTDPILQMEAKGLARADAMDEASVKRAEQEWWDVVRTNRAALVGNNVELFYLGWNFISNSETEAMSREYWDKTIPAEKVTAAFEEQKSFLRENRPYEFQKFAEVFREKSYTKKQAQELLPLIASYKSNLLVQADLASSPQKHRLQSNVRFVEISLGRTVDRILNPPLVSSTPSTVVSVVTTQAQALPAKRMELSAESSVPVTNIVPVKKFLEIPLEGLDKDTITAITITSHHLVGDKLLLDVQLSRVIRSFDADEKLRTIRHTTAPAIAILDIKTERWQVIECDEVDFAARNPFYHHTTLWCGSVFTSQGGKIARYDTATKKWTTLDLPGVGNCGLFVVGDRLFATTRELIVEIQDQGKSMQILASKRRQPPVSILDSVNFVGTGFVLGTPALFGDDSGDLRVITANKIFSWQGSDWQEIAAAPPVARPPWIANDHVLFFGDGWNTAAGIWRFPTVGTNTECLLGAGRSVNRQPNRLTTPSSANPIWETPSGVQLAQLPAATRGNDLYLLVDHAKSENIVNEREHVITGIRILPQNGYHAALLCFTRNHAMPQKVFLKFDEISGVLPVSGNPNGSGRMPSDPPEGWLCFAAGQLVLGRELSGLSTVSAQFGEAPKAGVWVISLEQVDAAIEHQRQRQVIQTEKLTAERRQKAQHFLDQFDRDRDGLISGEEKVSAFADENFVASQLDQIDTNQNCFLDPGELKFFDANKNGALDSNELTGIRHAQQLLAVKLLRRDDSSGDGILDRRECDGLLGLAIDFSGRPRLVGWIPDYNRDNLVDVEEVQTYCEQQTVNGLQIRFMPGRSSMPPQFTPSGGGATDSNQRFKALVEEFWRYGGTNPVAQPPRQGLVPQKIAPSATTQ